MEKDGRSQSPASSPDQVATPPPENAAETLAIPRIISEILAARGISDPGDIKKWLNPSLKGLKDPFLLTDMGKAIDRLVVARQNQEPIVIYADYDLDGTSGLALFLRALNLLGFSDVIRYQPKRLSEGYGLHTEAVEKLHAAGRKLLMTIDLGITALEACARATELGLDVIITDHHLPKEQLPVALAVINPNRGNCGSGLGHLCGTGVAFYVALALRRRLLELGVIEKSFDPKELLDCFAIGTLTDMVPLVDENRVLVKHGLLQLAQTRRPGLRVLLQALGLWGIPLTSQDVAIRFAPKLNALSRMEMGIEPIDLYLVEDESAAQGLVERVLSNNQTRQASQKSAEVEAAEIVEARELGHAIFVYSKNFHRGVVGLVATKLCQEYGRPAFVGSLAEDSGKIVGSARMPNGLGLNALDAMATAHEVLEQFGGHAAAAGFELKQEMAERFSAKLECYFALQPRSKEAIAWKYDVKASLDELSPSFMTWFEHLNPFGVQFEAPVFLLEQIKVEQIKELRGGHLRLNLSVSGLTRVGLWFSPPQETANRLRDLSATDRWVDLLVEPQWNYYNGSRTLQLLIRDLRNR